MKLTFFTTALAAATAVNAVSIPVVEDLGKREPAPFTLPTISNNPLGFATATAKPSSYGFIPRPPPNPTNAPNSPTQPVNATLSTSNDARQNPFAPNSPQHRGNWLPGFDINTDYTQRWPTTSNTVRQTWVITNTTFAPDGGTPQIMLLINGQYPGPLLEGNWGDHFEITVINKLQNNGTGIHWHGLRQLDSNYADGVPGITECPIAPGSQKTYSFQATGYGSTWYHSHFSAQYGAGVVGPLVIHGPNSANWDIDLGSVMLNEWYPLTGFQEDYFAGLQGPPTASNYLVNGRNIKPDGSSGQRTQFQFQKGKKHLMRFVNNGLDHFFKVSIDGHQLLVIANDNVPINPYYAKEISIGIGQRYDVVVVADQSVSNYYLRTIPAAGCSSNQNNGLGTANAIISYAGAGSTLPANNATGLPLSTQCADEPLASLVPIVQQSVDPTGFAQKFTELPVNLERAALVTGENVFLWYLNGVSLNIDWANPTIEAVSTNRTISSSSNSSQYLPASWNAISLPTPNVWTFWVIQNQFFVPHPMHLHGHDYAILGEGNGTFDPTADLASLNFQNPTRRDVSMLIASGWTVIAFKTDNPGSWLMHCHIAWHVGEGLALQFVELPSQMPQQYSAFVQGPDFQNECEAWDQYAPTSVYGKTDSGLKRRVAEPEAEAVPDPFGWTDNQAYARVHDHMRVRRSMHQHRK